jgi:hypothetical protein
MKSSRRLRGVAAAGARGARRSRAKIARVASASARRRAAAGAQRGVAASERAARSEPKASEASGPAAFLRAVLARGTSKAGQSLSRALLRAVFPALIASAAHARRAAPRSVILAA